jgi:hypothetical protein
MRTLKALLLGIALTLAARAQSVSPPPLPPALPGQGISNGPSGFTARATPLDCAKMPGASSANLDAILNSCEAYVQTALGGTADASNLGTGSGLSQTITSQVNSGELLSPTLTAQAGGSLTSGAVYKVAYTLNSPAGTSSASEESSITPSGSNLEFSVASPTYFGTATTYDVWVTAANGASWTETKCTSSPTAIGSSTTVSSVGSCTGTVSQQNNEVVTLLPAAGVWSCTATSGYCLKFFDQSTTEGKNSFGGHGLTINLASTGSVTSVCATDPNPKQGGQSTHVKGLKCNATAAGATVTGAAFEWQKTFDMAGAEEIEAQNNTTYALWLHGSGYFKNVHGTSYPQSGSTGTACVLGGASGTGSGILIISDLYCPGTGTGNPNLNFTGGNTSAWIFGLYMERGDTACGPWVDLGTGANQLGTLHILGYNQAANTCTNSPYFVQIESHMSQVELTQPTAGTLTNCINDLSNPTAGPNANGTYTCAQLGNASYRFSNQPENFMGGLNIYSGITLEGLTSGSIKLAASAIGGTLNIGSNASVTAAGALTVTSCTGCGSSSNPMTTLGDSIYGGASGTQTRLPGPITPNGVPQTWTDIPAGGAAVAEIWSLPGISGRAVTGTTSTDTIGNGSGTGSSPGGSTDCNPNRVEYVGSVAVAVALPTATALGVPHCVLKLVNNTTGSNTALTVTPTTWTVNGNPTLTIAQGQQAFLYVDPNSSTNWVADVSEQGLTAGSNVTFTRSATGLSIAATGGGTPCTTTANSLQYDNGGAFGCVTDFTASATTLTAAAGGILNMGSATGTAALVVPSNSSNTASAAGALDFDTTNKNFHGYVNGADSIFANFASAPTNNVLPKAVVASGNTLLGNSLASDSGTTFSYTGAGGLSSAAFTATGTTAGFVDYPQGSTSSAVAPCNTATSICEQAPTAVTSYLVTKPGAAGTGIRINVNASNVVTQSFTGSFGALDKTAQTAAITGTNVLCAATAGTACGQAGQYRITYNFWGSGTACSSVTAGSVGLNFTWTDEQGNAHSTVSAPLYDQKAAATGILFNFNTALTTESASGVMVISTNGTAIDYNTTYTACTTGTGAYNVRLTTEQLQ